MEIYKKIKKVKDEVGKITKDKNNPFHKNKYFDINTILEKLEPILEKNDLMIIQPIEGHLITTKLIDMKTSEAIQSSLILPELTDPQKMGSAITYYRRYTLTSLLTLQGEEDDDGNLASGKVDNGLATEKQIGFIVKLFKQNFNASPEQIKRSLGKSADKLGREEAHDIIEKFKTKEGVEFYGVRLNSLD